MSSSLWRQKHQESVIKWTQTQYKKDEQKFGKAVSQIQVEIGILSETAQEALYAWRYLGPY